MNFLNCSTGKTVRYVNVIKMSIYFTLRGNLVEWVLKEHNLLINLMSDICVPKHCFAISFFFMCFFFYLSIRINTGSFSTYVCLLVVYEFLNSMYVMISKITLNKHKLTKIQSNHAHIIFMDWMLFTLHLRWILRPKKK